MKKSPSALTSRNPFIRKGSALVRRAPRLWSRVTASPEDYRRHPPILANSFPKSGTHLLSQVLEAFPGVQDHGTFWASRPSVTFRERSPAAMARRVGRAAPGELVRGHVFHHADVAEALRDRGVVHYFIYRDLRDVVVSEAHYLARMNRWHRLHRLFRDRPTDADRIMLAITGAAGEGRDDYPDVGARFRRYRGWLEEPDVFPVRFEDLAGPERESTIRAMAGHYLGRAEGGLTAGEIVAAALESIDPARSHTFRKGQSGGWRDVLEPAHREALEAVAGPILAGLGYGARTEP